MPDLTPKEAAERFGSSVGSCKAKLAEWIVAYGERCRMEAVEKAAKNLWRSVETIAIANQEAKA